MTAGASLLAWAPLRRRPFRPWLPVPLALVVCLCLVGGVRHAAAQPGPSLQGARDQLDQVVGNRVEATAILGGQVPQGGLFGWSFNDVEAGVLKYPWGVEVGAPRPLGAGGLTWTPVLLGSIGAAYFTNHFRNGPLEGNESTYTTYSLGAGGGPRIGLLPDLSVLPSLSLLYAYTENDFDAGTDRGRDGEQAVDGRLVNWHTHTLTFIPSLELRYRPTFGPRDARVHVDLLLLRDHPDRALDGCVLLHEGFSGLEQPRRRGCRHAVGDRRLAPRGGRILQPRGALRRPPGQSQDRPLLRDGGPASRSTRRAASGS